MRLWKLKLIPKLVDWNVWDAFIIRAETEGGARKIAQKFSEECVWRDTELSGCEEIFAEGEEEVLLDSYIAG